MTLHKFLKDKFNEKKKNNKKYSLRSFARNLGVPVSRLSEVMNGKSGFSEKRTLEIAKKLKLSGEEKFVFINLNLKKFGRSKKSRELSNLKLAKFNYKIIPNDIYPIISDWWHFAILELSRTKDFKSDVEYIAKKLKITKNDASEAVNRLINNKLLRIDDKGNYNDTHESLITPDEIPSEAVRKAHKQILEKGILALENQEISQRDFNAHIAAFSKSDIKKFKMLIEKFMSEASSKMNSKNTKDSVYCLSVNFFELTN